jgi:hypothetical protein
VPVFNIKAATETHIPVVVDLIYVGEIRVPALLLLHTCGGLCDAATIRNHCSVRLGSSWSMHSICKRCTAATTTVPTAAAPAHRLLSSMPAGVSSNGQERLLHRDSNLLDGRHMKLFRWGKGSRVLCLGRTTDNAAICAFVAAICDMMAGWLAASQFIAAATSLLMAMMPDGVALPPVVVSTAACMTVVTVLSSVSLSSPASMTL